jgi:hypothetical protein
MPVHEKVVKKVCELEYEKEYLKFVNETFGSIEEHTINSVEMNIHNRQSMIYYLLYKKYQDRLGSSRQERDTSRGRLTPQRLDSKASLLTAPNDIM